MSSVIRRNFKLFSLLFLGAFFFAGRPVEFAQEASFFQGFLIPKPIIRVALDVNLEDVEIRASSGMKVYLANSSYKLLADDVAEARVRGTKETLSEKFSVVLAQTRRRDEADRTAKELRTTVPGRIFVQEDRDGGLEGVFQVRAGDFLTRTEALNFLKRLGRFGLGENWIVRDEVTVPSSKPRWVLVNDELLDLDERTTLYFIPSHAQSYLAFGGKSYRGIFVLRGSRRGVLLINILNLEDYLKGVVPVELSPVDFGELEALKAQAVAARTYALKNLRQFDDLGFDLYDTPTSQVYDGLGVEHPLSSRAVEETRGLVAVHGGELINALYMSTCGGRTENAEAMFGGPSVPYLRSTDCLWEGASTWTVTAPEVLPAAFADGRNLLLPLARLRALGVIPPAIGPKEYGEAATAEEAAEWARKAAAAAGKKPAPAIPAPKEVTVPAWGRLLAEAFGWDDRIRTLIGTEEASRTTADWPDLRPADRPLVAFLLTSGIIGPDLAALGKTPLTRARVAAALDRAVGFSQDPYRRGTFRGSGKNEISILEDGSAKTLPLAPDLLLVRTVDGSSTSVSQFEFQGGESVRWVETEGRVRLLEVSVASLTSVLDGSSRYHRWQVRASRQDLEDRLNQYYPVGKLIDLVPKTRGASQRLLDLLVVGQEGQVHMTGMKIRNILGLRDNLFAIDRDWDAEGRVSHFLFDGKGWGHGVGLCQVGAFRMAQKGAGYGDILRKYYRGISLKKSY